MSVEQPWNNEMPPRCGMDEGSETRCFVLVPQAEMSWSNSACAQECSGCDPGWGYVFPGTGQTGL